MNGHASAVLDAQANSREFAFGFVRWPDLSDEVQPLPHIRVTMAPRTDTQIIAGLRTLHASMRDVVQGVGFSRASREDALLIGDWCVEQHRSLKVSQNSTVSDGVAFAPPPVTRGERYGDN